MSELSRREFVGACTAVLSVVSVGGAEPVYIYASESAAPGLARAPLVIGFLVTSAPEPHIDAIRRIKADTRYPTRQVTYRSTDSMKLGCARELLRYFVRSTDLRFWARIVTDGDFRSNVFRGRQFPALFKTAGLPAGAVLRMKSRRNEWGWGSSKGNGAAEHASRVDVLQASRLISRGEAVKASARDGLVELSNLLTGTLFGARMCAGDLSLLHPIKRDVLVRLQTLLALERIDRERLAGKWEPQVVERTQDASGANE